MRKVFNSVLVLIAFSMTLYFGKAELWSGEKMTGNPRNGKLLYDKLKCNYCHRIGSEGGSVGPDLTKESTKGRGIEWQINHLIDPKSAHSKHPDMPKFDKLTDKMLLDIASYMESLK